MEDLTNLYGINGGTAECGVAGMIYEGAQSGRVLQLPRPALMVWKCLHGGKETNYCSEHGMETDGASGSPLVVY